MAAFRMWQKEFHAMILYVQNFVTSLEKNLAIVQTYFPITNLTFLRGDKERTVTGWLR